jgi:hypothetical protein
VAHLFACVATETLDARELVLALGRLAAADPAFRFDESPAVEVEVVQDALPASAALGGIEVTRLKLAGMLAVDRIRSDDLRGALDTLTDAVARDGTLIGRIGYEARDSRQSRHACDSVSVSERRGERSFQSSRNGSRSTREPALAVTQIDEAAAVLGVPIRVRQAEGHFYLAHRDGGSLWLSGTRGPNGASPDTFRVEWNRPWDQLVATLDAWVTRFGSGRLFEQSWSAISFPSAKPEEVLRAVVEARLPARRYEIELSGVLSDVEHGLEVLRSLSGRSSRIEVELGSAEYADDTSVQVLVQVSARGHRLRVESRYPLDPVILSERLGCTLTPEPR